MATDIATLIGGGGGTIKSQEFLSSGTWVRPAGVDLVWVTMCAGGGGGGSGAYGSASYGGVGGAGGGGGEIVIRYPLRVTGNIAVTVGAGGSGATRSSGTTGNSGGNGGNSAFGPLTVEGGFGGARGYGKTSSAAAGGLAYSASGGGGTGRGYQATLYDSGDVNSCVALRPVSHGNYCGGAAGGVGFDESSDSAAAGFILQPVFKGMSAVNRDNSVTIDGQSVGPFPGGLSGAHVSTRGGQSIAGGGGGGFFGPGGNGGNASSPHGSSAPANSGAGGGGGTTDPGSAAYTGNGGAGGSGRVLVEWFE